VAATCVAHSLSRLEVRCGGVERVGVALQGRAGQGVGWCQELAGRRAGEIQVYTGEIQVYTGEIQSWQSGGQVRYRAAKQARSGLLGSTRDASWQRQRHIGRLLPASILIFLLLLLLLLIHCFSPPLPP
jgi:hypothetical protein